MARITKTKRQKKERAYPDSEGRVSSQMRKFCESRAKPSRRLSELETKSAVIGDFHEP